MEPPQCQMKVETQVIIIIIIIITMPLVQSRSAGTHHFGHSEIWIFSDSKRNDVELAVQALPPGYERFFSSVKYLFPRFPPL